MDPNEKTIQTFTIDDQRFIKTKNEAGNSYFPRQRIFIFCFSEPFGINVEGLNSLLLGIQLFIQIYFDRLCKCRIFQIVFTAGGLLSRSSHPSFSLEILSHNCRVSHLKSSKSPWPIFSSSGQIRFKFAASRIIMIIMHFRELESGGGKMRINALFDDQEVVHEGIDSVLYGKYCPIITVYPTRKAANPLGLFSLNGCFKSVAIIMIRHLRELKSGVEIMCLAAPLDD